MTEKLQKIVKEEISKLPKENQQAINAFDWVKITEEIGKKYLLDESEINDFQVETLLILIGLEDPDSYARNIENEIGTSREKASEISEEVFQKIFIPINDLLVENIKKSEKIKDPKWDQNLDFILSGGNYGAFVENPPRLVEEGAGGGDSLDPLSNLPLGKGRSSQLPPRPDFGRGTPPQKGGEENKTTIEIRPEEIT